MRVSKTLNKVCSLCGAFVISSNFARHWSQHSPVHPFKCQLCPKKFPRDEHRKRHVISSHLGGVYSCSFCSSTFKFKQGLLKHRSRCKKGSMN